jgi:hypothetical protein
VDVEHWQLVGRGLKDVAIVMDLHEFAPVGGRFTGWRAWWWLERFAQVCEDLPDRPRLCDERDQPDVTATVGALERLKTFPVWVAAACSLALVDVDTWGLFLSTFQVVILPVAGGCGSYSPDPPPPATGEPDRGSASSVRN